MKKIISEKERLRRSQAAIRRYEEQQEEIRYEIEYLATKFPDSIFTEDKGMDLSNIHIDQAPKHIKYGHANFSSIYLETGLKQFDSWYCKQIMNNKHNYTKERLSQLIKRNPHLHNKIKTNLLENLENARWDCILTTDKNN